MKFFQIVTEIPILKKITTLKNFTCKSKKEIPKLENQSIEERDHFDDKWTNWEINWVKLEHFNDLELLD